MVDEIEMIDHFKDAFAVSNVIDHPLKWELAVQGGQVIGARVTNEGAVTGFIQLDRKNEVFDLLGQSNIARDFYGLTDDPDGVGLRAHHQRKVKSEHLL